MILQIKCFFHFTLLVHSCSITVRCAFQTCSKCQCFLSMLNSSSVYHLTCKWMKERKNLSVRVDCGVWLWHSLDVSITVFAESETLFLRENIDRSEKYLYSQVWNSLISFRFMHKSFATSVQRISDLNVTYYYMYGSGTAEHKVAVYC